MSLKFLLVFPLYSYSIEAVGKITIVSAPIPRIVNSIHSAIQKEYIKCVAALEICVTFPPFPRG